MLQAEGAVAHVFLRPVFQAGAFLRLERTRDSFGEGSSAALHGDTVVMNWDHEGGDFIAALDKRTGADRWKSSRDEITTWSTPLVGEHEGKAQVVVNATGAVRGYYLASGKPLSAAGGQSVNAIPSPVTTTGLVIVMSGYTKQTLQAIRLGRTASSTRALTPRPWLWAASCSCAACSTVLHRRIGARRSARRRGSCHRVASRLLSVP